MDFSKCITKILGIILVLISSGCATQPKHFIQDNLPEISNDMSRIIVTREKQLAGAGSPMIVIDIGEGIAPNAMLHIKDMTAEEILKIENFASIAGVPSDNLWLWFDSKLFKPLFCITNDPTCIKYHRLWPRIERGQLLYGIVINIRDDCIVDFGYEMNDKISERIWREELKPVEVSELEDCDDIQYHGKARVISFIPFWDELIAKGYFKKLLKKKIQGFEVPDAEGYFVPVNFVSERYWIGSILPDDYSAEPIDLEKISRKVQVIGSVGVGETLIWDRKPGIMRLGSAWWDGLGFMPKNIQIEAGKTYYLHYEIKFSGQRWELTNVK